MAWICYSCGQKNPDSRADCLKCGGSTAAPRKFYLHWVFGGAVFFLVFYTIGMVVGGTLIELAVAPSEPELLSMAKQQDATATSLTSLTPEALGKAKTAAITQGKQRMSTVVRGVLQWMLPFLLYVVCGALVGFASDGRTVIEAALGSIIGQGIGFSVSYFKYGQSFPWYVIAVVLAIGFVLSAAGAWLGEAAQEKLERRTA